MGLQPGTRISRNTSEARVMSRLYIALAPSSGPWHAAVMSIMRIRDVARRCHWLALAVLLLVALGGCKQLKEIAKEELGASVSLEIDDARLVKQLEARGAAASETPEFDKAMNITIDAIGADPAVAASGEKLLGRVGNDRNIAPAAEAIIASVA